MISMVSVLIASAVAISAFLYGAYFLFRKKKPLYFQLYICAVGCFVLELLFIAVASWCQNYNPLVNLGLAGFLGCNFFLFSANHGQLDSIVDDGSSANAKAKAVAAAGPAVIAAVLIFFVFLIIKGGHPASLLIAAMMIPACPASYFNIKHLVMPVDAFGFLKATKSCNILALTFYFFSLIYVFGLLTEAAAIQGIAIMLLSVLMLLSAIFSVKGAEQWTI